MKNRRPVQSPSRSPEPIVAPPSVGDSSSAPSGIRDNFRAAAQRANSSRSVRILARAGLSTSGLVHIAIGAVALVIAFGGQGHADQQGVLAAVADTDAGNAVLWAATVALIGLAFWQWTDAAWVTAPRLHTLVIRRLADLGKAIGFAALALATGISALGHHNTGDSSFQQLSRLLLESPVGAAILMLVAAAVAGVGLSHLISGISRSFERELAPRPGPMRYVVAVLGLVGHLTKGIAFLIVAGLMVAAAAYSEPEFSGGLDGALHYLASLAAGAAMLSTVAVGLIAYGLYLIARALYLRRN